MRHACFFAWSGNAARRKRSTGGTTFGRYIKLMRICPQGQGKDQMRTALTIAGSDSSGGAGIQADIKTMTANGVYAMSAITALTAQNTTGVTGIMEVTPSFLAEQLDCIFTDIFPDAVKTGMVSSSGLIETIASKLRQYGARNIVVDPVMVATSGARLISEEASDRYLEKRITASCSSDHSQYSGSGSAVRNDDHIA